MCQTKVSLVLEDLKIKVQRLSIIFVYSKSEYTLKSVSVSVRAAGRLHDYSWKAHSIVMKFSTQLYLINISLEFEDENNLSRIYWVTPRNIIIFYANIDLFQFSQIKIFVIV
jgi:hypothetical protein